MWVVMRSIVGIWICLESSIDVCLWSVGENIRKQSCALFLREGLRASIPNRSVNHGPNKLGVIFVLDFLMHYHVVLCLLIVRRLQESQL